MKKIKLFALCLLMAGAMFGCSNYDDTELRNDVSDLKSRIKTLESWCNTANGQISALQGIVSALEQKDCITGVTPIMEGSKEVGYTITFTKSKPITIMHGKDGAKGDQGVAGKDAAAPIIGVKQDTDGHYYWTVKIGTAAATWMLDDRGNKIRTTGDKGDPGEDGKPGEDGRPGNPGIPGADGNDGHSPVMSVAEFEGRLYWQIDGEWLLHNGEKVPATGDQGDKGNTGAQGPQGDSIFAENGIDYTSDVENVIFTLADGVTKITLPKASSVSIGFGSYETFFGSDTNKEITLTFPETLKEMDYTAIVATMTNENGTGTDIQTRSAATEETWGVKVTKPTFGSDGKPVAGSGKVTILAPANVKLAQTATLKVTITDKNGKDFSTTRPVKYFAGTMAESTAGNLKNVITNLQITKLAIMGSLDASDFEFIRTLPALELLDLSMTDLTAIPNRALRFDPASPNTTLKRIVIPASVTTIDEAAFANCQALEAFDTENTESLGKWAFENCYKLRSVKLGNKLTTIYDSAFRYCTALNSIAIPTNVRSLGRWVFNFCENLETITLHEGLQTLSQSTFYGCGVVSIRIPSTVTEIPAWAFQGCKKLERVTMHDRITEIGEAAFLHCQALKSVKIPAGVTVIRNNMFEGCVNLQFVTFHDGITEIQERAFAFCERLSSESGASGGFFILPTSLITLGMEAFTGCRNLISVNMTNTEVTAIPNVLFSGCVNLVDVKLPKNLQTIGRNAFIACKLAQLDIPASIKSIGDFALNPCPGLTHVICRATNPPTLGVSVFDNNKTGRTLNIPKDATTRYSGWTTYFERFEEMSN